ncbi:MAG: acylase [Opitutus sp.]|nr:acylase [Opitutus sp.]
MKRLFALILSLAPFCFVAAASADDLVRWKERAANVTLIRDTWGIPHVYGKTDADAVFGLLYAQAEDDFNRVELNYVNALGRLAEIEGEKEIYRDLRMKLFIDPTDMQAKYAESPAWLRALMDAFADGLNYYLHTHPAVKPKLITHFEPWMALTFSEGSIGGDIESIALRDLEDFYGPKSGKKLTVVEPPKEHDSIGSNGFAIGPKNTTAGHALLLINPHTSFYFRPEVNVVSDEGLNAYGAVTWGQFFVYQGFNDRVGWMHTSGGGDVIDEYLETIVEKPGGVFYRYGDAERPLVAKKITLPYKSGPTTAEKTITAYFSHQGPIVRAANGKWVAVKLMQEPVKALMQSYGRTKAKTYAQFLDVMQLRTNSSNNTVYADADGNIAYWHGNFVPVRDPKLDWTKPVDGANAATEWKGLHAVKDTITLLNPANGWLANTNNWPFSAAGPNSPRQQDFPRYMWKRPENPRGFHAVRVLTDQHDFTLEKLIAAAFDSELPAFEVLVPALLKAYDDTAALNPLKAKLAEQIAVLRAWDHRWSVSSVATSLAIFWAQDLIAQVREATKAKGLAAGDLLAIHNFIAHETTATQRLEALARASAKLQENFGTWKTPWGEINRFQRLSGEVGAGFDDAKPSLPVGFTASNWGSLAAFSAVGPQKTKKIYGGVGNSFVAVVEFGPRLKAKSLLAGGESGDPASPHFNDQAALYAKGQFKEVWFYREDVEQHAERKYHPGN